MKNILVLFFSFILFSNSFSQDSLYSCNISRDDYSMVLITNTSNDSIILSIEDDGNKVSEMEKYYFIRRGEGRKKDQYGDREKWKKYLFNQDSDTLITIRNNSTLYQIGDSIVFRKEKTQEGWKFLNDKNEIVCNIKLMWNDAMWSFEIENLEKSKNLELLNRAIMLSLVNMATSKSKCECEETGDDDFWFIMWVTSLVYI